MAAMARAAVASAMPLVVALLAAAAARGCAARDFDVGGRDGWTTSPAEPYNHWAERTRFQVNDSLVFRYNAKEDAVLVVNPSHYDACDTADPIARLDNGYNVFKLWKSGPYFFISGDAARCRAGERLIVVVLAVRNNTMPSPPLPPSPPSSRPSPSSPPTSSSSPPPPPPSPTSSPPSSSSHPPPPPPLPSSSPPPPKSAPPHVPGPAPVARPLPPSPPAARNASSPSPSPAPMPGINGMPSKPSPSSASALRAGVLACLVIGGAAILV
ncbi:hypothetical protein ACP70R_030961 [Stipagrostis hirtigluma subsp. patula]